MRVGVCLGTLRLEIWLSPAVTSLNVDWFTNLWKYLDSYYFFQQVQTDSAEFFTCDFFFPTVFINIRWQKNKTIYDPTFKSTFKGKELALKYWPISLVSPGVINKSILLLLWSHFLLLYSCAMRSCLPTHCILTYNLTSKLADHWQKVNACDVRVGKITVCKKGQEQLSTTGWSG